MKTGAHILVVRLSAMGDVALGVPVLRELLEQHTQLRLTILTRASFAALFSDLPRTRVFCAELKGRHGGLTGIYRLFHELKPLGFNALADLHNVIRSRILSMFFRLGGLPVACIDKGRAEKKKLTRRVNKELQSLKHTSERYADVFRKLGFALTLSHRLKKLSAPLPDFIRKKSIGQGPENWIGIAPFAKHKGKQYPIEMMGQVISRLQREGQTLFIFGGGAEEKKIAAKWASVFPNVISTVGEMGLQDELALISHLDLMLTMDSSGMHLASIAGTPVVSVWGATHPYAGFLGYGQDEKNALLNPVPCRPCSIFGNKPCYRSDAPYVCLKGLEPGMVAGKINDLVNGDLQTR